ncbi:beta-glucosidase [Capsulimonas corticalis]|uniref:Beta-glucosidase n=1 Tax=Capsulimonas corticalis TaxID=2219043 RepID=A0A402D239_9BACT|nr:glycoside hydrolase family 3 N-terminal domain-containing protein [Capsulimonas corticalis]BDI30159.1 beta-glucosidase [Capsulimonas corticalis]
MRKTSAVWLLSVAVSLCATASPAQNPAAPLYKQRNAPLERRIQDLLGRMTVEEKARQLDMYPGTDIVDKISETHALPGAHADPQKMTKALGAVGVGSIHDLYPDAALYNEIQRWVIGRSRLGIPALFIEEGLHGFANSYQDGTLYPQSINLAATWNPDLARRTAGGIAAEARSSGVDMLLGPVLDVAREPRWGRVEEDFGEDPYLTGEMGAAYVRGMQGDSLDTDHTVISEPKHFVGHGSPEGGLNTAPVHAGEREIRTTMLRSFEPAIRRSHAMAVMAAYHEIDGVPCPANSWLLTTVLRKEWGFQGFVLADLGAIRYLYDVHHVAATPGDAVRLALTSGLDMQFYDFDHATFQNAIISGVHTGTLSPKVLDQAVSRVLRVKFALGLFDRPYVDTALSARAMRSPANLAATLQSSRQSLCLLKNEHALLPLAKTLKKIAVIGPNADTGQTGDYTPPLKNVPVVTVLSGVKSLVSSNTEVVYDDGASIDAAVAKARGADAVILCLGERQGISGEGFDRSSLDLPGRQEELLEAVAAVGAPTVLVLQNGRPLALPWAAAHVPAILEAWYPGERGGQAVAETLFGDNNPAGRLPISFPRSIGALPDFYNYDRSKTHPYIDGDTGSLFPFGHGLSYTSFQYQGLTAVASVPGKAVDVTVSVNVTNTGGRAGDEVVQLYLKPNTSSVETPERALKGFRRITLKPGETRKVTFHLTDYELEVWNMQGKWAVEPGDYTVTVGGSSRGGETTQFSLRTPISPGQGGILTLAPRQSTMFGPNIRLTEEVGREFVGYWDNPTAGVSWVIRIPSAGHYRVGLDYSTQAWPTAFDIVAAGKTLRSGPVKTSGWMDYKHIDLGPISFPAAGVYSLAIRAHDPNNWKGMNVGVVTLTSMR